MEQKRASLVVSGLPQWGQIIWYLDEGDWPLVSEAQW
jgi:hypothetical protein